jgi:Ca2+-binding RTX toxin-like protein
VETVNINVADAGATGSAAVIHTLTLVATSAKTVTVSGNNGLTLTNANTAITTFDASGVVGNTTSTGTDTAANLAVTFASANTTATASVTIKGGAGNDTLTGTVAKDTIEGNDGADTIYADNAGNKTSFATANIDVTGTPTGATTVTVSFMGLTTAATSVTLAGANPTATEIQTAVKAAVAADPVISKLLSVTSSGAADLVFASLIDGTNTTAPVVTITPTGGAATYTAGAATAGTAGAVAVDSVSGGAGADVLLGGGGGDTLTGGAGVDTFFFLKGQSNLATMTKISDYTYALGGTQNDKIVIGDVTSAAGTVTTVQDLSSAQSLAAALDMAATNNTVNNGISWFIYGGNTYVYVETTGATGTYQAADFVVEITGTPVAAGTAIAGLGGDGI